MFELEECAWIGGMSLNLRGCIILVHACSVWQSNLWNLGIPNNNIERNISSIRQG